MSGGSPRSLVGPVLCVQRRRLDSLCLCLASPKDVAETPVAFDARLARIAGQLAGPVVEVPGDTGLAVSGPVAVSLASDARAWREVSTADCSAWDRHSRRSC